MNSLLPEKFLWGLPKTTWTRYISFILKLTWHLMYENDLKLTFSNSKVLSLAQVMDVLLVHYQPSSSGSVQVMQTSKHIQSSIAKLGFAIVMNYDFVCQACVVATLAALAYNQPHGMVPFLKVSIPSRLFSKHYT